MELWTPDHVRTLLPSMGIIIVFGFLLRKLLGKKSLKVRMIPFQIVAVMLVLLEIGKQTVSLSRGYDLYHLPLHVCSIFIFMLPLAAFWPGKAAARLRNITAGLCGAVFLFMVVYPNLIYSAWDIQNFFRDYLGFHTVVFHNLVLLAFVLFLALDVAEPEGKADTRAMALFALGFSATAATMAQLLKTNFANFYACNIPPLQSVRMMVEGVLGYGITQVLYVCVVALLHVLFMILSYWLYRGLRRLVRSKTLEKA